MNTTLQYYSEILNGKHGRILQKHKNLARIAKKHEFKFFAEVHDYILSHQKYDTWTLRDVDKSMALLSFNLVN